MIKSSRKMWSRKPSKNMTTNEVDKNFFKEIPRRQIKKLYDKIYKVDFEMFGYKYPFEQIQMGSENK